MKMTLGFRLFIGIDILPQNFDAPNVTGTCTQQTPFLESLRKHFAGVRRKQKMVGINVKLEPGSYS